MSWIDTALERSARRAARRISRRSFLRGWARRWSARRRAAARLRSRAEEGRAQERRRRTTRALGAQADRRAQYWHCAIDGFLCSCCGGSQTGCPPGTQMAQSPGSACRVPRTAWTT
jgi:methylamine dehydrogenase light chain